MASRECNGGTQPVAWKSSDGKLWFATTKGVAMIDPNRARAAAAPPVIDPGRLCRHVRWIRRARSCFPQGPKTLEFRYAGINLAAPEKVHYQYRLEGLRPRVGDAGTRRLALVHEPEAGLLSFPGARRE